MHTVLVVEDSLTEIQKVSQYLIQAGWAVLHAASGEEAQRQLSVTPRYPDVIILDVILPGQSGFELCRELKSDPKTRSIPVVMCSTKSTDTDKMWGQLLGADAYLAKPVDPQELIQTLQRLLRSPNPTVHQ